MLIARNLSGLGEVFGSRETTRRIYRNKIMKHYFPTITALAVGLLGSVLVRTLNADEWDKRTIIKIHLSIDVQGTVLSPGSYVIKLLDEVSNRDTVEIFRADDNHLIATLFAIPAWKLAPTDNSEFTFYEAAGGRPPALHKWFYPGGNSGFEFVRSRRREVAAETQLSPANVTNSYASQP